MTSLLERSGRTARDGNPGNSAYRLPQRRRNRRTLLASASAAVVLVSVAAFVSLYSTATRQSQVIVATQRIEKGAVFTAASLGEASVAVSGAAETIPVALSSTLAGKRAAVTIPAGSLLVPADVSGAPQVASGDAVAGIALKDGQYPSTGLRPGDQVMIVQTASPGSPLPSVSGGGSGTGTAPAGTAAGGPSGTNAEGSGTTGVLVPQAQVFDVTSPSTNSGGTLALLVSVEVPITLAADVSTAAVAGQVSLVLLPDAASSGAPSEGTRTGPGSQGGSG